MSERFAMVWLVRERTWFANGWAYSAAHVNDLARWRFHFAPIEDEL